VPEFKISPDCAECLSIRAELADALKAFRNDALEREKNASIPFAERIKKMTDADWNEMAEARRSSKLGQLGRKAQHHQLLTGHFCFCPLPGLSIPPYE
jgi:hypothetical protein